MNSQKLNSLTLLHSAAVMLTIAMSGAANSALAADPKVLGSFKDWNAFALEEGGKKVCFMSSQPKKQEAHGRPRGEVYILVTHRPAEKSYDVVSVMAGYTYKGGTEVTVQVDANTFKLFTEGDTAWARDETTDRKLTDAIRTGDKLIIKGLSSRGTNTVDTYSLNGSGAAYKAISDACGAKR